MGESKVKFLWLIINSFKKYLLCMYSVLEIEAAKMVDR